jgi:hypothetical protein
LVVPPGEYVIEMRGLGSDGPLYYPGVYSEAEAEHVIIREQDLTTRTRNAPSPGWVRGQVMVAAPGVEISRDQVYSLVSLELFGPDSTRLDSVNPDSDGRFECRVYAPATVRLHVIANGFSRWYGGETYDEATRFDVRPGEAVGGIEITQTGFFCTLTGPGDQLESHGTIRVADAAGHLLEGESGSWFTAGVLVLNLRPGTYFLQAEPSSDDEVWASQWYDGADSLSGATPVTIEQEGTLVPVVFHLVAGGRIAGRLRNADGTPLSDQEILLTGPQGIPGALAWTYSSDTGSFTFVGLADGEYLLMARRWFGSGNHQDLWYPGTEDRTEATVLIIRRHAVIDDLEWSLPAP